MVAPSPRLRSLLRRAGLGLAVALGLLVLGELLFRAVLALTNPAASEAVARYRVEMSPDLDEALLYDPHPYFAYVQAQPRDPRVVVNSYGFSGPERSLEKAPGVTRLAVFGGSTSAAPDGWVAQLADVLEERAPAGEYESLNFAQPAWTSQEAVAVMALLARDFSPDVVISHCVNNDLAPMRGPTFRPDYSHYRKALTVDSGTQLREVVKNRLTWRLDSLLTRSSSAFVYARMWLSPGAPTTYSLNDLTTWPGEVMDRPLEAGVATYLRNLSTLGLLAEDAGATFVLTTMPAMEPERLLTEDVRGNPDPRWLPLLEEQNERIRTLGEERGWLVVDLAALPLEPELFTDAIHLTREGDGHKARAIAEALLAADLVGGER